MIFGAVCGLLRTNDVFEGGHRDGMSSDRHLGRVSSEIREPFRSRRPEREIEIAEAGHQVQQLDAREEGGLADAVAIQAGEDLVGLERAHVTPRGSRDPRDGSRGRNG